MKIVINARTVFTEFQFYACDSVLCFFYFCSLDFCSCVGLIVNDLVDLLGVFTVTIFNLLLFFFLCIANISCRDLNYVQKPAGRQLFISKRVVTESEEFDGGVIVNKYGKIEGVLRRSAVDMVLQKNEDLKVHRSNNRCT